jgi:hypothetical protein
LTPSETVILTRYVKALCPAQAIDDYTPDAWHDVLGALPLDEARSAVVAVASQKPFCAPSEILAEVAKARGRDKPHSGACRIGDHRDCRVSWCNCACHPAAIEAITDPAIPLPPPVGADAEPGDMYGPPQ